MKRGSVLTRARLARAARERSSVRNVCHTKRNVRHSHTFETPRFKKSQKIPNVTVLLQNSEATLPEFKHRYGTVRKCRNPETGAVDAGADLEFDVKWLRVSVARRLISSVCWKAARPSRIWFELSVVQIGTRRKRTGDASRETRIDPCELGGQVYAVKTVKRSTASAPSPATASVGVSLPRLPIACVAGDGDGEPDPADRSLGRDERRLNGRWRSQNST